MNSITYLVGFNNFIPRNILLNKYIVKEEWVRHILCRFSILTEFYITFLVSRSKNLQKKTSVRKNGGLDLKKHSIKENWTLKSDKMEKTTGTNLTNDAETWIMPEFHHLPLLTRKWGQSKNFPKCFWRLLLDCYPMKKYAL